MLNQDQLLTIKKTWERLMKRSTLFESTFTNLLSEIEPRFEEMYVLEKKNSPTPAFVVFDSIVKNSASVEDTLRQVKIKYSCYGITQECVEKISLAFLLTLERLLGSRWNNTMRDTWAIFISTIILLSHGIRTGKEYDKVHQ